MDWSSLRAYFLSTALLSPEVRAGLVSSSQDFCLHLLSSLRSLFSVCGYLLLLLCKLSVIAFPYLISLGRAIVDFHVQQLSPRELALEFLFISVFILLLVFRRRLALWLARAQQSLAHYSQMLARALPAALLLLSSLSVCLALDKSIAPLALPSRLPLFTSAAPLALSVFSIYRHRLGKDGNGGDGVKESKESKEHLVYRHLLCVWVIAALYHSVLLCLSLPLSLLPFSFASSASPTSLWSVLFSPSYWIKLSREMVLVISLYIQLSPALAELVLELVLPLMKVASSIPSLHIPLFNKSDGKEGSGYNKDFIVRMLQFGGLKSTYALFIVSLFQDGVALILSLLFLFTPAHSLGVAIASLLFPAFKSLRSIERIIPSDDNFNHGKKSEKSDRLIRFLYSYLVIFNSISRDRDSTNEKSLVTSTRKIFEKSNNKNKDNLKENIKDKSAVEMSEEEVILMRSERKRWIDYWICLSILMLTNFYIIRIWPSVMMITTLYMQHSYFQGSTYFINLFKEFLVLLHLRNKQLKEEIIKRKSTKENLLDNGENENTTKSKFNEKKNTFDEVNNIENKIDTSSIEENGGNCEDVSNINHNITSDYVKVNLAQLHEEDTDNNKKID